MEEKGEEVVIAHGHMVDAEPVVECLKNSGEVVDEESMQPQFWREVRVTTVVTGHQRTAPHKDSVFGAEGELLASLEERSMSALAKLDSCIIWRDYVVPRRKELKKVRPRKKK